YVSLIYGMSHFFNVIRGQVGTPQGVLIRAIEQVDGIEGIRLARYNKTDITKERYRNLTSGPGKL
ncbi:DNA-3-methyladenine glycosylase, partial [Bacillus thuringiensis]|nr:DNA-3-methyladenine glycosylase [Bacillus thuringiensis]